MLVTFNGQTPNAAGELARRLFGYACAEKRKASAVLFNLTPFLRPEEGMQFPGNAFTAVGEGL